MTCHSKLSQHFAATTTQDVEQDDDAVQAGGAGGRRCRKDCPHYSGMAQPRYYRGCASVLATLTLRQLCLNHFVETYDPTIEDSYRKQVQIDGQSCMLEVLDTAGQEEYTALRDQWIRDGEGFVLVYSISSRSSFSRIQRFYSQIQRVKESAAASSPTYPGSPLSQNTPAGSLGPAPVMLVGNKCDRVTEREVSTQEGQALAKQLGCDFLEASAKNCVNVEKAFYDVVRQLRGQRSSMPRSDRGKDFPPYRGSTKTENGEKKHRIYRERGGARSKGDRPSRSNKCVIL